MKFKIFNYKWLIVLLSILILYLIIDTFFNQIDLPNQFKSYPKKMNLYFREVEGEIDFTNNSVFGSKKFDGEKFCFDNKNLKSSSDLSKNIIFNVEYYKEDIFNIKEYEKFSDSILKIGGQVNGDKVSGILCIYYYVDEMHTDKLVLHVFKNGFVKTFSNFGF